MPHKPHILRPKLLASMSPSRMRVHHERHDHLGAGRWRLSSAHVRSARAIVTRDRTRSDASMVAAHTQDRCAFRGGSGDGRGAVREVVARCNATESLSDGRVGVVHDGSGDPAPRHGSSAALQQRHPSMMRRLARHVCAHPLRFAATILLLDALLIAMPIAFAAAAAPR